MTIRDTVDLLTELALVALTVVVAVGMGRLFVDGGFLPEILALVVASHLVAAACRRAGLGMAAATLISLAASVLLVTALLYGDTARGGVIPTSLTVDTVRADFRAGWEIYAGESPPVPVAPGLVLASGLALWWVAFLADWAAFRLRSPLEALAPATAVFVFTALLGAETNRIVPAGLFAAAALGVLLGMRASRRVREEVWIGFGASRGIRTTVGVGLATVALAAIAGVVGGPLLPGAEDPAWIDVTELDDGPETRFVVSPLVEISSSLVDQADVELFSVAVDRDDADYWRLMALSSFDGEIWRQSSSFDDAVGTLDRTVDDAVTSRTLRQEITTTRLGNIYLPAAFEVAEIIDDGGVDLEYEAATGALVVRDEAEARSAGGVSYVIESTIPEFDPAVMGADATGGADDDFVRDHTSLPDECTEGQTAADGCWPPRVTELAQTITAAGTTDYERARLLQDWFLDPSRFRYDLDVHLRHDIDDIEDFLYEARIGYCEQFSSAFASMARSIGLPSRVAVGFTWGEWDEARQEYVVRGEHAHAWPEIHFADVGWVSFEPTPGRGRPGSGDITAADPVTGRRPAQVGFNDAATTPAQGPEPAPTTSAPAAADDASRGQFPEETPPPAGGGGSGGAAPAGDGGSVPTWLAAVLVLAVVTLVAAAAVPFVRHASHRRRLSRVGGDPVGRAELAWDDALDALRLVDIHHHPHETPTEFAARVTARSTFVVGPIGPLAADVTALRYGATQDREGRAAAACEAADEIRRACVSLAGRRRAVVAEFDPRTLLSAP